MRQALGLEFFLKPMNLGLKFSYRLVLEFKNRVT